MVKDDYPTSKEILLLLGVGTLLAASTVLPGLGVAAGAIIKAKKQHDFDQDQKAWKKFNIYLLRRNLKRLQAQKIVGLVNKNGQEVIKLTKKGHTKYLQLKLEDISYKSKSWDGKWRLVIYDVAKLKRAQQECFRRMLKQMNFHLLQKSVYLTPYRCEETIEYLREYFNLGEEVLFLEISKLENENHYKQYFGF
jgi:hypothetical protein